MQLKKVSYSLLSTYESCPQKYFFSYIRGIYPEKKPKALAIGSAIHLVLAELYRRKKDEQDFKLVEASNIFLKSLEKEPVELDDVTPDIITLKYQSILKTILENPLNIKQKYIERFYRVKFKNPLTDETLEPKFSGIMDLITEDKIIVEHKTSSRKWTTQNILETNQHIGYYVGYSNLFHELPSKVLYDIIYKIDNPIIDVFEVAVSKLDVKKFFDWSANIIKKIELEDWTPKPSHMSCLWCDYKNICPRSS